MSPIEHNSAVGQDINQIILTCMSKFPNHRFASCDLLQRLIRKLIHNGYSQGLQPDAQSELVLPRLRQFEEFRFLELLETLLRNDFSGVCNVWNAFQECEIRMKQGQIRSVQARNSGLEPLKALTDVVCWEAGNFYLNPEISESPDNIDLEATDALDHLKASYKEFRILWEDYHDYDLPELIMEVSDYDRFSPVVSDLVPVLDTELCLGQIYALLPYSRTEILNGLKELEDRQYIFIERIRD